jgi:glycosyltransferase involved in cell wall biosynthesis
MEAGFPESKLIVHYIGVDLHQFSAQHAPLKDEIVLFVGRLVEKKGCEHLLHAMRIVQRRVDKARLVVVGDGPLRGRLSELASGLGVRCEFLGVLSSSMICNQLNAAKVFCVPSVTARNGDSEGLGMVFLEAQAMGLPVVSFDHGGIPEAVCHGKTGLLAPEGNHEVLADHILRYLLEPEFASVCGRSGAERVRTGFDLRKQTEKLEQLYEDVIAEWSAKPGK